MQGSKRDAPNLRCNCAPDNHQSEHCTRQKAKTAGRTQFHKGNFLAQEEIKA